MKQDRRTGVLIESGAQNWQVFQQANDVVTIDLTGRWRTETPHRQVRVVARVMHEACFTPVLQRLAFVPGTTRRDGTWSLRLRDVPAGGLYRIETALQLDDGPVEWSERGDMVHHVGVGDVWVIAGQSNAAGYGKTPVEDAPELGLHMFHASGRWTLATHPLGDSTDSRYPANRERANGSHSPWLAFARLLKQQLGYPIGLIPASLGGSPISAWDREQGGHLFENMLRYVEDSGGGVRGVVWYQGESDTAPASRRVYSKRFQAMARDFRRSLKRRDLPIVTAQLNRYVGEDANSILNENWEGMRELQRQIAHKLKNVFVVSTLDLGLSDGIHTDSAGNMVLAHRMASTVLGGVFGQAVKYRHPDCQAATSIDNKEIELRFDNIDERLHFESHVRRQFPFVVRDRRGEVPVVGWRIQATDRLVLELGRVLGTQATVTGGASICPGNPVPVDIAGYLPMLGFTIKVKR